MFGDKVLFLISHCLVIAWGEYFTLRNVALNKPASQSSSYWSIFGAPGLAVDGYFGTNVLECTHNVCYEVKPWWSVDLQDRFRVEFVQITNRGDCCSEYLQDFDVYVTDYTFDPKVRRPPLKERCFEQPYVHYNGNLGATGLYPCFWPIVGRYVTLVLNRQSECLSLCEVEVLTSIPVVGDDALQDNRLEISVKNVAAFKPVSQSTVSQFYGSPPEVAVDLVKGWSLEDCMHTACGERNPWWRVDLQGRYPVEVLLLANRVDCCGHRLKEFAVYVTDYTFDPKVSLPSESERCVLVEHFPHLVYMVFPCPRPTVGRYVTLVLFTEAECLHFAELEVLTSRPAIRTEGLVTGGPELTNVALYKPASQSSYHSIHKDPNKANDGSKRSYDSECIHTSCNEVNPWWRVDLVDHFSVEGLSITNSGHRLANFSVYVTNHKFDPKVSTPPSAERCMHEPMAVNPGENGATATYFCSGPIIGRYVTLVLYTLNECLNFCEMEVLSSEMVSHHPNKNTGQTGTGSYEQTKHNGKTGNGAQTGNGGQTGNDGQRGNNGQTGNEENTGTNKEPKRKNKGTAGGDKTSSSGHADNNEIGDGHAYVTRDGWLGSPCSMKADCLQANSYCFKRICLCLPGYYFSVSTKACLASCPEYDLQPTFSVYPDSRMRTPILDTEVEISAEECSGLCRGYSMNGKTCRSFSRKYTANKTKCFLHDVIAGDEESDFKRKLDGWNFYQRNCA